MTEFPLPAAYADLEPAAVWQQFGALNQIPRPSGAEDAARAYIQDLCRARGVRFQTDARGNICVELPASGDNTGAPIVVLQSHLDMVCQQRPGVAHDWTRDAVMPRRDGDQISATGTTLGADNGLGAAMMVGILTSDNLTHPPLELLFTVEEETGLFGAAMLDPTLVKGRLLINLDSEDPDEITIGCAGGADTTLRLPIQRAPLPDALRWEISVSGLAGGHSGIQIGEPLGNAIKILTQVVNAARIGAPELRLIAIDGGTAHNAIPRDAVAHVAVPVAQGADFDAAWKKSADDLKEQWHEDEPNLDITRAPSPHVEAPLDAASTATTLELLRSLPHGVSKMSERFEGKVQTSSNLAEVVTSLGEVEIHVSNRSFVASDIQNMQEEQANLGVAAGALVEARDGYPGWEPRAQSPLREQTAAVFERVTGTKPRVEVVHAGLECGLLSEKLEDLDAVSFGPLIRGAHTPEEWASISSLAQTWQILTVLLEELA